MAVSYDLQGQRLLVVGGSSGLGREIGLQASRAGARVAFAARRRERLEEAVGEASGDAVAVTCDVRDEDACERAVAQAAEALGGLDGFVYSTGMSPLAMLDEATADEWRTVMETNLIGAALVTRAALPLLSASQGRAVYLSSYAVRNCMPGLALYRVSKLALDGLIESFRNEHPELSFTRVVVGNTEGSEFGLAWGEERAQRITRIWIERNVFPANTTMSIDVLAEAVLSVLAVRGYVDDVAVMPRQTDTPMET